MKIIRITAHIILSLTAAFLTAGVPALYVLHQTQENAPDAVSGASIKLPDKPSGEYIVLLNRSLHEGSAFRAQLPENQMRLRRENALLLASKAENGCIDAAIFSKETAEALKIDAGAAENIICIEIKGGEEK